MRRVRHWIGGTLSLGLLAAGLGGCGESESNKGDDGSNGSAGSNSGGSGGSSSGGSGGSSSGGDGSSSGGSGGGTTDGTPTSTTGDETASDSGNTTGSTISGDPVPFEDYAAGVSAILCEWLTPCCSGLGVPVTEMACSDTLGAGFAEDYAAADPDNYTYDPEKAGDCLATAQQFYRGVGCELSASDSVDTSGIEVCNSVFEGKLEPGSSCAADIECAKAPGDDVECTELDFGTEATVCVVERRAAEGESCYWTCTEESGGGYTCSGAGAAETPAVQGRCYTNDGLYCADGVCEGQAALGEPCTADAGCSEGYCSGAGECTPGNAAGAACTSDTECGEGLYCEGLECSPKKANGEECAFSNECQSEACNDSACAEASNADALAFVCVLVAAQL